MFDLKDESVSNADMKDSKEANAAEYRAHRSAVAARSIAAVSLTETSDLTDWPELFIISVCIVENNSSSVKLFLQVPGQSWNIT